MSLQNGKRRYEEIKIYNRKLPYENKLASIFLHKIGR
jgi:hypothetical protein